VCRRRPPAGGGEPHQASAATLCLINQQRATNGLGALAESSVLDSSATKQSTDMVDHGFFDHVSPTAGDLVTRMRHGGYIAAGETWSVGENVAWGQAILASPARTIDDWMHSPEHRANILKPGFREVGVGVVPGVPVPAAGGLAGTTYTADFGSRSGGSASAGTTGRPNVTHRGTHHRHNRHHRRRHH